MALYRVSVSDLDYLGGRENKYAWIMESSLDHFTLANTFMLLKGKNTRAGRIDAIIVDPITPRTPESLFAAIESL